MNPHLQCKFLERFFVEDYIWPVIIWPSSVSLSVSTFFSENRNSVTEICIDQSIQTYREFNDISVSADWKLTLNNRGIVKCAFLDISWAFDNTTQVSVRDTHGRRGVNDTIVKWFYEVLTTSIAETSMVDECYSWNTSGWSSIEWTTTKANVTWLQKCRLCVLISGAEYQPNEDHSNSVYIEKGPSSHEDVLITQ